MRAPPFSGLSLASGALLGTLVLGTGPVLGAGIGGVDPEPGVEAGAEARGPDRGPTGVGSSVRSTTEGFYAPTPEHYEFYFTRAIYSSGRGRGLRGWGRGQSWATDYPKADRQFLVVIKRILKLDAYDYEHAVSLADPAIRNYPFLYALEVGYMNLTQEEVRGLRDYLDAGGFLVIDDFWGTREWEVFEYNMRRVLPGRPMVELPLDHELFGTFFDVTEIKQVPNVRQGRSGGPTWEQDGYEPHVLGIFDDDGHLMVVINWNTDLGDAWEWAEDPFYPLQYSNFAYEMGANLIIYGMTH